MTRPSAASAHLPGVPAVRDETVTIQAFTDHPTSARLELHGVLAHRDPGPILEDFFRKVHHVMIEQKRNLLHIDMRDLRFMNSSSFKHFVTLVKDNDGLPPEQRYAIKFFLNPEHHWQKVSMHALRCFSMDAITIDSGEVPAQ